MSTKTLGILGGMGPKATAVLYDRIVEATDAKKDQEHIRTIMLSDTDIPDRTEAIISGKTEKLRSLLISDAEKLESFGADVIVMPCNTAHLFIDDIRDNVGSTVIHMVEAAAREAVDLSEDRKVGIMSTDGTIQSKIYDRTLERFHGTAVYPPADDQKKLMEIIYDDVKNGGTADPQVFGRIAADLQSRCDTVILACTELSLIKDMCPAEVKVVDAMDSAVYAAISACGAQVRKVDER